MPDKKQVTKQTVVADEQRKHPTFHIHNCPQELIDRVNAKSALKGKKVSQWVIQVLERETIKLKTLQDEYKAETEE